MNRLLNTDNQVANYEECCGSPGARATKYVGAWIDRKGRVTVMRGEENLPLCPWHDLALMTDHCFKWGRTGSGAVQTALAILADFLHGLPDGDKLALKHCDAFHHEVIARLPDAWVMTGDQIEAFLAVRMARSLTSERIPADNALRVSMQAGSEPALMWASTPQTSAADHRD